MKNNKITVELNLDNETLKYLDELCKRFNKKRSETLEIVLINFYKDLNRVTFMGGSYENR